MSSGASGYSKSLRFGGGGGAVNITALPKKSWLL